MSSRCMANSIWCCQSAPCVPCLFAVAPSEFPQTDSPSLQFPQIPRPVKCIRSIAANHAIYDRTCAAGRSPPSRVVWPRSDHSPKLPCQERRWQAELHCLPLCFFKNATNTHLLAPREVHLDCIHTRPPLQHRSLIDMTCNACLFAG